MFDPAISSHFHLVQFWDNVLVEEIEEVHSYSSETRAWSDRASKWKRGEKDGEWGQWGQAIMKFTFGRAVVNGLLYFIIYHVQKSEALILQWMGKGKHVGSSAGMISMSLQMLLLLVNPKANCSASVLIHN
jgi:hypothetical protein